jgi:hypothetical protein
MKRTMKTLTLSSILTLGAFAAAVQAQEDTQPSMKGGMMGEDGMMNMMEHMGQMNQMMEQCNKMMAMMMEQQKPDDETDEAPQ